MLAAIKFDYEPGGIAGKVRNVGTDRHLTAKLVVNEAAVPQQEPKFALGLRCTTTKAAREPLGPGFCGLPLTRPAGTLSHEGRGTKGRAAAVPLLPSWEKVVRRTG